MKVSFIGAGPGDPKLLTIRGKEAIERARVVIYAGSLVSKEVLKYAVNAGEIYDSARLNLEEIGSIFKKARDRDLDVARIHSGDPTIYSAVNEQMRLLDRLSVPYEVIPGISSFQAASAALCQELTLPGVCQTVTLTRIGGKTPVPEKEALSGVIKTRPTLVIFLSISKLPEIVETLKRSYPASTPVVVAYSVSRPDEEIITGTVGDIVEMMDGRGITKTALVIVGEVLHNRGGRSLLYDKNFSHLFRSGQ